MKEFAKSLYHLSIFFDCTYAEYFKKSRIYDEIIQESREVMHIVAEWNIGNLIILPVESNPWGAINDALNILILELIEGIKQLPDDSSIKIRFRIPEIPLNINNITHYK